ncbi:MAG: putative 2OG-Fe(II) oxygenase [Parvularculaceae bacterium]
MSSLNELTEKANALKAAGDLAGAIAVHEQLVRLAPTNGAVLHNHAAALGDAGRNLEAISQAERAFATGLDAPQTWLVLARALAGAGRADDSIRAFRESVRRQPLNREAQRELAQMVWMRTADLSKALEFVDAALKASPQSVELKLLRGEIIGQSGDARGEYDEVSSVLADYSGQNAFLELAAVNAALAAGRYDDALKHARTAMDLAPGEQRVIAGLCRSFLAVGEAREAALLASRLHATYPLDQFYIALLATAWRMLGDERCHYLYNYDRFVGAFSLSCPNGWASVEAYVDDLLETLDRLHNYETHPYGQSVRHGSQLPSIFSFGEPVLDAYKQAIRGPIQRFLQQIGAGGDPLRVRNRGGHQIFSAWSIRLKASGYHINHVHPEGWLSSACHLRMPKSGGADDKSGWLTFGEPGIPTTPKLTPEYYIKPQIGVMAIFPSYMWHGTVPFSGDIRRTTIAIDLVPAPVSVI